MHTKAGINFQASDHSWQQARNWLQQQRQAIISSFEQAIQLESLPNFRELPADVIAEVLDHEFRALVSFFEEPRDNEPREVRRQHSRCIRQRLGSVPSSEQLRFLLRRQELIQRQILDDSSTGTFRPLLLLRLEIATTYGRVLLQRIDIERQQE